MLACVNYMHSRGIVHRDIKPDNLLIANGSHVPLKDALLKLIDFGISRTLAEGEMAYTKFGTPDYVAPEIISGQGYSQPIDVWALGVLTAVHFSKVHFRKMHF